jgi:cysteine desulfurase
VSVMAANNETGVIADLRSIADLTHASGAILHTDATQIVGKLSFDVGAVGADLASLSAHKLYGPKGVGALYVSKHVRLAAQVHGGGHEGGLRSGTTNVAGVVGFGAAAQLAGDLMDYSGRRQRDLVRCVVRTLTEVAGDIELVGANADRIPNTANVWVRGADAEAVIANVPQVMVSTGSACTALTPEPSHVLLAMGLDRRSAEQCIRISVGRTTTQEEAEAAAQALGAAVVRVRELSNDGIPGDRRAASAV